MKSHEYGQRLVELGQFLQSRPEFDTPGKLSLYLSYWSDKDGFLAAVRALGSGTKEVEKGTLSEVRFIPTAAAEIQVSVSRDKVCTKVQEERWECEPLLSTAEEAELEMAG